MKNNDSQEREINLQGKEKLAKKRTSAKKVIYVFLRPIPPALSRVVSLHPSSRPHQTLGIYIILWFLDGRFSVLENCAVSVVTVLREYNLIVQEIKSSAIIRETRLRRRRFSGCPRTDDAETQIEFLP